MSLTGTAVNYYTHCKRQCWLFSNRINMEDNSEDVKIGKVLHELKNDSNEEQMLENIKLDKITSEYVVEIKKSDSDIDAAKAQLEYYLYVLRKKGINKKGRLECIEKNKQDKKVHIVEISENNISLLEKKYEEIELFIKTETPPSPKLTPKCRKCAYYAYCFV